jgi:hypothetical protein
LVWACGLDNVLDSHDFHNAGNDAYITMLAIIAMLVLFSGGSTPGVLGTKLCPIFCAVDFEGGERKNRTKIDTEAGVAVLDPLSLVGVVGAQNIMDAAKKSIKTSHFIFNGDQHVHPTFTIENSMKIWRDDPTHVNRPRWNFVAGATKTFTTIPKGRDVQRISADTQIVPRGNLAPHLNNVIKSVGGQIRFSGEQPPGLLNEVKPFYDTSGFPEAKVR